MHKMNEFNEEQSLTTLNKYELKHINGGQPSDDTGFWYDVAYIVVMSAVFMPNHTDVPGAV